MINRRKFIVGASLAPIISAADISFAAEIRKPFVEVGDSVSFLYFEDWTRPFHENTNSAFVSYVGNWNGSSYDIILSDYDYRSGKQIYWDAIDSEWSMFRKEVPDFSWKNVSSDKYPNIHSYIREKRFGEDPEKMRTKMESNLKLKAVVYRGKVPTRDTLFEDIV